jgi:hypothetical protein
VWGECSWRAGPAVAELTDRPWIDHAAQGQEGDVPSVVVSVHRAALAQGATDSGPPGLRPDYGDGCFATFVLDTSGNNREAAHLESVEREA